MVTPQTDRPKPFQGINHLARVKNCPTLPIFLPAFAMVTPQTDRPKPFQIINHLARVKNCPTLPIFFAGFCKGDTTNR